MNKRITEDQARMTFERTMKLEHEFGEYFTGNICSMVIMHTYCVCGVMVNSLSSHFVWKSCLGQTKVYEIGICYFSAQH